MANIQRKDAAIAGPDVTYPALADSRGSARIRRSLPQRVDSIAEETEDRPQMSDVYLGPFQSPVSYVVYGLWLHGYQQHGKNLNPQILKQVALNAMDCRSTRVEAFKQSYGYILAATAAIALISTSVAIFAISKIPSSSIPPMVDDIAMSEDEKEFVRGMRQTKTRVSLKPALPSRHAELLQKLREEPNVPLHKLSEKP